MRKSKSKFVRASLTRTRDHRLPFLRRRTYSLLSKKESLAAKEIYSVIRKGLSKNHRFFLSQKNALFRVATPLGEAIIEPIASVRPHDYKGNFNLGILKAKLGKKEFFIKIDGERDAKSRVKGFSLVNAFLKKHGGCFNGFVVRVMPIRVAHDFLYERYSKGTIYVTDFFPAGRFVLAENILNGELHGSIETTLLGLRNAVRHAAKVDSMGEISSNNAFFDVKKKEIVLFDLHAQNN